MAMLDGQRRRAEDRQGDCGLRCQAAERPCATGRHDDAVAGCSADITTGTGVTALIADRTPQRAR
jgi:hypothetical protein